MPTIFRLPKEDIVAIVKKLKPEIPESELESYSIDKLKILISEWLLLKGYSSIHNFRRTEDETDWKVPDGEYIDCNCCWRYRWGRRNGPGSHPRGLHETISISPTTTAFAPFPESKRYDQMMFFNGPWVLEETVGKRGKKQFQVRSYLLRTTSEKTVNIISRK